MLDHLAQKAQVKATQAAQTAVLGLGASLLLVVGLGFLTAAFWIYLATVSTALTAATVIGGIYFGAGLIMIAMISARNRSARRELERLELARQHKSGDLQGTLYQIILAFMSGIQAGQKGRRG